MGEASSMGLDFKKFMFPGIIGMTILFTSISSGLSVVRDKDHGFLKEILVAPVERIAVAGGRILGGSTVAMIQATYTFYLCSAGRGFHNAHSGAQDLGHSITRLDRLYQSGQFYRLQARFHGRLPDGHELSDHANVLPQRGFLPAQGHTHLDVGTRSDKPVLLPGRFDSPILLHFNGL